MTIKGSTNAHGVVGIILHTDGTLRLFVDGTGRMYAEVVGFTSDRGREFLSLLGGSLEDISSEILVCDDPEAYQLRRAPQRSNHYRRAGVGTGCARGARAGTVTGTVRGAGASAEDRAPLIGWRISARVRR